MYGMPNEILCCGLADVEPQDRPALGNGYDL